MSFIRKSRFLVRIRRVSFVLLIALSLSFSAYDLFKLSQNWDPQAAEKNEVSIWENRLQSVKEKLPSGTSHIGYTAEWDIPGATYGKTDQFHEFNLTKYTLAPLIVHRGVEYPWIMGNFGNLSSKKIELWLRDSIGSYAIENIGGGIYLIHRVQK
jgi:hypothetical protein